MVKKLSIFILLSILTFLNAGTISGTITDEVTGEPLIGANVFIIDTNLEELAVKEGLKLNIPIAAIVDTNSDPVGINYPIPGNDDARRAINLYCELIKQTVLDAQTNIKQPDSKDEKIQAIKEESKKKDINKKELKKEDVKKKQKPKVEKKKSKSIFPKIKALISKKTK